DVGIEPDKKVVEGFGHGRVSKDAVTQGGVGQVGGHGDLYEGHDLPGDDAQHGEAQDLAAGGIDAGLDNTARSVRLQRSGHGAHRHLGYSKVAAAPPRLVFRQADSAQLGIRENRVGHEPVGRDGASAVQQVLAQ